MKRGKTEKRLTEKTRDSVQSRDPLEIAGVDLSGVQPALCVARYRESGRLQQLEETIKRIEESATVSATLLSSVIR